MILQVIPGTQGLYGLVGVASWPSAEHGPALRHRCLSCPLPSGLQYLWPPACPWRWAACFSGIAQGRVAAASINILAKKPDDWAKGMVLCITVEFYAILSLLASMLMIINISA